MSERDNGGDQGPGERQEAPARAMGQLSADDPSDIGTTIVGGQPPGRHRKSVTGVPVGIERVLYAAAVDPDFKARLLEEREAAVLDRGFKLRESELAMLRLAPAAQLESAIAGLDTSQHNLERRNFMRAVAASVVTLAAADTLSACAEDDVKGIRPDGPTPSAGMDRGVPDTAVQPPHDSGFDAGGIRPDGDLGMAPAGIRPDAQPDLELEIDGGEVDRGIRPDGGE